MNVDKVEVGMRVRYTGRPGYGVSSKMYPDTGTVGAVSRVNTKGGTALVQWQEGSTSHQGLWWCAAADLEPAQEGGTPDGKA